MAITAVNGVGAQYGTTPSTAHTFKDGFNFAERNNCVIVCGLLSSAAASVSYVETVKSATSKRRVLC